MRWCVFRWRWFRSERHRADGQLSLELRPQPHSPCMRNLLQFPSRVSHITVKLGRSYQ